MSNTLRLSLRCLNYSFKNNVLKLLPNLSSQPIRFLYAKSTLGIDGFKEHQKQVKLQLTNIEDKFRERMNTYADEDTTSMIFTEDLKNMIHLAQDEADFNLVVKMAKKFNGQNKELRFGNFIFGPVLMRMFYVANNCDLALECFKSRQLDGFLDQLITYQILMDLLYENGKYQEMLKVYEIIKSKQLQTAKYPRNVIVLVMAACFKLNSKDSVKYALNLWNELMDAGHFPMRRATTFCAGLAINQGKPEAALEIVSSVKNPNYVTIRNIKVRALSEIGRLDDAIVLLKSVISEDQPGQVSQTFNRDVMDYVKEAVAKQENAELALEFNRIENLFEKEGHISQTSLNEHLSSEIQQPPTVNNRQGSRMSRYTPDQSRQTINVYNRSRRPGLTDMA